MSEQVAEKVKAAHDEIARLCNGGRWQMTVPVNHGRDSDMILTAALDALEAALLVATAPTPDEVGQVEGLSGQERAKHADRADHFPPNQLVYSLTSVERILAARTGARA